MHVSAHITLYCTPVNLHFYSYNSVCVGLPFCLWQINSLGRDMGHLIHHPQAWLYECKMYSSIQGLIIITPQKNLLLAMINAISFSPGAVIGFGPYAPLPSQTWSKRTKMFLLLAQGWIKRIVLQVYIPLNLLLLFFHSSFTPGDECQEENKEKEIHQLWDGETSKIRANSPLHSHPGSPQLDVSSEWRHEAVQLCSMFWFPPQSRSFWSGQWI